MKIIDAEIAIARYFGPRVNVIVPNVSWGADLHECDVLVLTGSGYAYEVEIKTSKADLIRDRKKIHAHRSPRIKQLWFCLPQALRDCSDLVPEHAGILLVKDNCFCEAMRSAKNTGTYKFTDAEKFGIARLGTMRIWTLKTKIRNLMELGK